MSASTIFDEIASLSDSISNQEDRIEELREQFRSFNGEGDFVLPAEFNPDAAAAELSKLLRDRLRDTNKHRELTTKWQNEKAIETRAALADAEKRHKAACIAALKSAIALARAVADAERIRSEAADIAGRLGAIQHWGPSGGHFSLKDHSWVHHWCHEARERGYVTGKEDWLRDVKF